MKFSMKVTLGWVALVAFGGAVPVLASQKSKSGRAKTKLTLETYPAMEEVELTAESSPSEIHVSRTEPGIVTPPPTLDSAAATRALEERVQLLEKRGHDRATRETLAAAVAPVRPTPPVSLSESEFETVPSDKTDMIAARIRLVEAILRETGRAYDYRTQTSNQLRRVLAEFRGERARTVRGLGTPPLAE